jgi:hypothetical protein
MNNFLYHKIEKKKKNSWDQDPIFIGLFLSSGEKGCREMNTMGNEKNPKL